ncbi:hypothetical protein CEP53_006795 [Fusarium sp. AF-6]|nr:hypothetical protein CEP53_006795 [Fusarium sp. AF-6]
MALPGLAYLLGVNVSGRHLGVVEEPEASGSTPWRMGELESSTPGVRRNACGVEEETGVVGHGSGVLGLTSGLTVLGFWSSARGVGGIEPGVEGELESEASNAGVDDLLNGDSGDGEKYLMDGVGAPEDGPSSSGPGEKYLAAATGVGALEYEPSNSGVGEKYLAAGVGGIDPGVEGGTEIEASGVYDLVSGEYRPTVGVDGTEFGVKRELGEQYLAAGVGGIEPSEEGEADLEASKDLASGVSGLSVVLKGAVES